MDRVQIQADFTEVLNDITTETLREDYFWVKISGDLGNHFVGEQREATEKFRFRCYKDTLGQVAFECQEENESVKFIRQKNHEFTLLNRGKTYSLKCPTTVYNLKSHVEVVSFDITSDGLNNIAFGDTNGNITYGSISTSNFKRQLLLENAHFMSDVSKVGIFPSNKVMLSSGLSDYTIKIWSLIDGSNPRIMREHKGRITDLVILGKGRNFISSSLDGSIVIWECGQGKAVYRFKRIKDLKDGVNVVKVRQLPETGKIESAPSETFFDLEGKICYAGHESGVISIWDLNTQTSLKEFRSISGSPVTSLALSSKRNELYAGYRDGCIVCWDYDDLKTPKWQVHLKNPTAIELKYGEARVNDMLLVSDETKLLVSCGPDVLVELSVDNGREVTYCVGYEQHSRVNQFALDDEGKYVYCCGKGGLLMRFSV